MLFKIKTRYLDSILELLFKNGSLALRSLRSRCSIGHLELTRLEDHYEFELTSNMNILISFPILLIRRIALSMNLSERFALKKVNSFSERSPLVIFLGLTDKKGLIGLYRLLKI